MKLSRNVTVLVIALAVTVVVIILLTPIGLETRPPSALKPIGYLAIGTIFAGLALFLAAIGLLFRKVRTASSLAIAASILFFFPVIGDQTGYFFSAPIPPAVRVLEFVLVVMLLVDLLLASMAYREARSASS